MWCVLLSQACMSLYSSINQEDTVCIYILESSVSLHLLLLFKNIISGNTIFSAIIFVIYAINILSIITIFAQTGCLKTFEFLQSTFMTTVVRLSGSYSAKKVYLKTVQWNVRMNFKFRLHVEIIQADPKFGKS